VTISNSYPPRRSIRLPEFDYSQPGAYFVTIVTHDRQPLFGQINDGEISLTEVGAMVAQAWIAIPEHFPNVELSAFVVMPNHIHGIISIIYEPETTSNVAARHAVPSQIIKTEKFGKPVSCSLPTIIRSFKSATTRTFHMYAGYSEKNLWQRNFYEHVIRNEQDYQAIIEYILANPMNWEKDKEFFELKI